MERGLSSVSQDGQLVEALSSGRHPRLGGT